MRNLIKVLTVFGWCLLGVIIGVVGVQAAAPTVTTTAITAITSTTASSGGNVTSDGGLHVSERGVCWSTSPNPLADDHHTHNGDGTGTFFSSLTSLTPGTLYHVRAYAKNSDGTSYGVERDFTTTTPTVTTTAITAITSTTATSGGNVTDSGGATVTARGVCWSISANPTTSDSKTTNGTGLGAFTSSLTSLTPGTLYHVRAYATNSVGTSYGSELDFTTLTVTTATITSITSTTASSGGAIPDSGGATITAKGVCWNTSPLPTTANSKTTNGTGAASFTSSLTSLTPGTLYHVRAYATNSVGTSYGDELDFTTLTVTTATITSITSTTASSGGAIPDSGGATITAKGVCWNTSTLPTTANSKTTNGTGAASFTSSLTSLTPGTLYHVRAYATNSVGTSYGDELDFTTSTIAPTVTTTAITSITSTTASSGGAIPDSGGATITAKGVCWNTSTLPTTANSKTTDGTGAASFTSSLTSLTPGTLYHVRAYATNSVGTSYGSELDFTTLTTPTVTTTAITVITSTTASSGGAIPDSGGATITAKGVCWSRSTGPTADSSHTTNGTGAASFTSSLTSLTPGALYHVRAYATNSVGTSYGSELDFTTLTTPTVTTVTITSITSTTASSGGAIPDSGGATITAKGVCWSRSTGPTADSSHTTNGTGAASFTSSLTSLTPGALYHVRAYATNSVGTSYGSELDFTTLTVTTATITSITSTTASSGGAIPDSGGATITDKGVCWNTSANPIITDSHTHDGTGAASFTSSLTSLTPGTLYHVRAYATNSVGTSYGSELDFTTLTTPTVTTTAITVITSSTASSGGAIPDSGRATITAKGVCWNTSTLPTTANSKTTNGTGAASFTSSLTSLTPGTLYHVRAYATNSVGTSYGNELDFTTLPTPTITTKTITAITCQSATCGGNITSDGGDSITARGVCWGRSVNPVRDSSHTVNASDTGSFVSSITGLTPNALYHVRAYATNSGGTSYGGDSTFTTLIGMSTVTTKTITSITSTTASGGGYVTSDCGDSVTARGVCWSVYANPTTEYPRTIDGSDIGSFTSTLTDLEQNTLYHVRAYATNSLGTSYGGDSTFFLRICTISGYVRNSDEVGMEGVVMSGLPDDPQTDEGGFYTATVSYGWSGTVTPTDTCPFLPESTYYESVSSDQTDQDYTEACFSEGVDEDKDNFIPKEYQLSQNQPNPFNPSTEIKFGLPKNSHMILRIYNIMGQEVITLVDRNLSAGTYNIRWNGLDNSGRAVSSGAYFYRMQAGDYVQTRQMLLLK